jgi:hypothetical protein
MALLVLTLVNLLLLAELSLIQPLSLSMSLIQIINRIVRTKIDGTGWNTYEVSSCGSSQYPVGIDFDTNTDDIYVSDQVGNKIFKLTLMELSVMQHLIM